VSGIQPVAVASLYQFQRYGTPQLLIGLKGRAEDVIVAHIHNHKLAVCTEAETILARCKFGSPDVEPVFRDQQSLILLLDRRRVPPVSTSAASVILSES